MKKLILFLLISQVICSLQSSVVLGQDTWVALGNENSCRSYKLEVRPDSNLSCITYLYTCVGECCNQDLPHDSLLRFNSDYVYYDGNSLRLLYYVIDTHKKWVKIRLSEKEYVWVKKSGCVRLIDESKFDKKGVIILDEHVQYFERAKKNAIASQ